MIFAILFCLFWLVTHIHKKFFVDKAWQPIPLPNITNADIHLNVAHVINDRFDALNEKQIQRLLQRTREMVRAHFNAEVVFHFKGNVSIQEFFKILPKQLIEERKDSILHPSSIDQDQLFRLRNAVYEKMDASMSDHQALIDFAQPYLIDKEEVKTLGDLSGALIDTLIKRISYWYEHNAADGYPIIDDKPYNQWVWWDSIGYGNLPYEIVITNQLIASIEDYDVEIHSLLRGGIAGGTMTYSRQSPYQAYAFISTYQLMNDNSMLAELKDDETYTDEQIINYAAATLTHEIGHLVFHFGHPFGVPSCIMSPTPLLKYRDWYQGLDAEKCHAANHPKMKHGSEIIFYNPAW